MVEELRTRPLRTLGRPRQTSGRRTIRHRHRGGLRPEPDRAPGLAQGSLSYYIALAFVGGLILNLMPCVLPVIGLKVMSFVEQSGKSRGHAFMLNVWFAAGIISVFLVLGLLAATIGLKWGGQIGTTSFNVTIAAVVFAMALSLLGVWEIPIPGFFGSGSVQSAAAKEGPLVHF